MNNYTITAPISGTVIRKNMKAGDKITSKGSGDGVMAVIYDLSSITFSMSIDELGHIEGKNGADSTDYGGSSPVMRHSGELWKM